MILALVWFLYYSYEVEICKQAMKSQLLGDYLSLILLHVFEIICFFFTRLRTIAVYELLYLIINFIYQYYEINSNVFRILCENAS